MYTLRTWAVSDPIPTVVPKPTVEPIDKDSGINWTLISVTRPTNPSSKSFVEYLRLLMVWLPVNLSTAVDNPATTILSYNSKSWLGWT